MVVMQRINTTHQGVPLTIEFDKNVYQPGPLTSSLCDIMKVASGDRVIDVGCGTGYIGVVASLLGAGEVICIDPIIEAINWTKHNARINGVNNITTLQGSSLDTVEHEQANVIISLPPQMPYLINFNPWRYGGPDGTDVILKIIRQASFILKGKGSRLYFVHSGLAYPARIRCALTELGFKWNIVKTVERELEPAHMDELTIGLMDYLLNLMHRGISEIVEREGCYYYPIWFYCATLK